MAAQALMAAGFTVGPVRHPRSIHGYFLCPGRVDGVILRVGPDRGRSFLARHVAAIQDGEVISSMLASFHGGDLESALDSDRHDSLIEIREVTHRRMVDGRILFPVGSGIGLMS